MRTNLRTAMALPILLLGANTIASAQNAALAQVYGNGVHAFYAGNLTEARDQFSKAINNGSNDPRTYYFRGIVAYAQGNAEEAESDWQQGAQLEAKGKTNPLVGRSLIRFQGTGRLELEEIRQQSRLEYAANQAVRSNQRVQEIDNSAIRNRLINPPVAPAPPAVAAPASGAPPPPPAAEDPFADELAEGEPNVTKEDALEGSMDAPFADEPAPTADADTPDAEGEADPFAEPGADTGGDPFESGGETAPADSADPFAEDAEDPFAEP